MPEDETPQERSQVVVRIEEAIRREAERWQLRIAKLRCPHCGKTYR